MTPQENIGNRPRPDLAIRTEQEGGTAHAETQRPIDTERIDHLAGRVRQQRKRQVEAFPEALVAVLALGTDAQYSNPNLAQVIVAIS